MSRKDMLRLTDFTKDDIVTIFHLTDETCEGKHKGALNGKSVVLFFPNASIRTRVTFEKGIYLLGGQPILFPTEGLDKREDLRDVCGYLSNWADIVIARHKKIETLERMAEYSTVPVINAMTDVNHPCEMIADMYALSKCRTDFTRDHFLFCGVRGNIGLAWKEAAEVMGFSLEQSCPEGYQIEGLRYFTDSREAAHGKDIICTDSLPSAAKEVFENCRVTMEVMKLANEGAILNPCPPFYRGEEVSEDVIESEYFVGYAFKKYLLQVQQAIMLFCLTR